MSEEIKEILEEFENLFEVSEAPEHIIKDFNKIKDYITNLEEALDKIKEKCVMYYDQEYSKIYGELCSMPGANNTRTPVIVIDDEILELLEEIE